MNDAALSNMNVFVELKQDLSSPPSTPCNCDALACSGTQHFMHSLVTHLGDAHCLCRSSGRIWTLPDRLGDGTRSQLVQRASAQSCWPSGLSVKAALLPKKAALVPKKAEGSAGFFFCCRAFFSSQCSDLRCLTRSLQWEVMHLLARRRQMPGDLLPSHGSSQRVSICVTRSTEVTSCYR